MKLLFLHGWGFDASLWDALRSALPAFETTVWDRGYFGALTHTAIAGPFWAVGHSFGSLLLAADPPPNCLGLVAINGFDRFAGEGRVPERLLDRMRARFRSYPEIVLDEFRVRVGGAAHAGTIEPSRLAADLDRLAILDARTRMVPRLVLNGGVDPILPPGMRDQVFATAPRETCAQGGHLLPLTHPQWLAERIRAALS